MTSVASGVCVGVPPAGHRVQRHSSGQAVLTSDSESSCSQLQPVCELLIPRKELVIVLGIDTGPSAGCQGGRVQTGKLASCGCCPRLLHNGVQMTVGLEGQGWFWGR